MDITLFDLFNILYITSGNKINLKSKKPFKGDDILDNSYTYWGDIPILFAPCKVIKVTVGLDVVTILIDW